MKPQVSDTHVGRRAWLALSWLAESQDTEKEVQRPGMPERHSQAGLGTFVSLPQARWDFIWLWCGC